MLSCKYECPCGHEWSEQFEAAFDCQCPECGEEIVECSSSEIIRYEIPDRPRVTWQVTRIIVETVQIEARSSAEALHLARDAEAAQWARDDCEPWMAETPPELRILGLPIR